jgi:glycosyltransferase involved in cell wall biosynthesis
MARVSVVIPAYNAERTLGATVESVLAQTFRDLEVLVIDDGSQDGTASVAASFGEPVTCITMPNGGVSAARNTGIERSSGELVAFLDADDLWAPGKLQRQIELLDANPDVGFVTTSALGVGQDLERLDTRPAWSVPDACEALLLHSMVLGNCSSPLIRRDVLEALGGFNPRFSQSADWDFFLRASRTTQLVAIDEPLVLYRVLEDSMSSDISLLERDTFAVLDAFYASPIAEPYLRVRKLAYSNHWMILSGSYLHAGQVPGAIRCLVNGVRLRPANLKRALALPMRALRRLRSGSGLRRRRGS